MLQPSTYPEEYPSPAKLEHLRDDSRWLGEEQNFYRAPLTTFFHSGRNKAGVFMHPNRGSGHECTGLNDGSKNTVATSYLADAWNWGTEIFCGCEVRFVEKMEGGGYIVFFAWHGSGRSVFTNHFKEQLFWVKAVRTTHSYKAKLRILTHSFDLEGIMFPRSGSVRYNGNPASVKATRSADVSSRGTKPLREW
jgi:hypothetical protein